VTAFGCDRREFLRRLSAGGASALAWAAAGGGWSCGPPPDPLAEAVAAAYADPEAARRVGAAWLAVHPDAGDPAALLAAVVGDVAVARELAAADPGALWDALRRCHRADFEAGRTTRVAGWVLSQTEARLCAWLQLRSG
jgi:hypothetical protein